MGRSDLLKHLELASRHAAEGKEHIARQRKLIIELEQNGRDITDAVALMRTLLGTQKTHEEHQARIQSELEAL